MCLCGRHMYFEFALYLLYLIYLVYLINLINLIYVIYFIYYLDILSWGGERIRGVSKCHYIWFWTCGNIHSHRGFCPPGSSYCELAQGSHPKKESFFWTLSKICPNPSLIFDIREVAFVLAQFGQPWGNFYKSPNFKYLPNI